jgi:hypothetical protein
LLIAKAELIGARARRRNFKPRRANSRRLTFFLSPATFSHFFLASLAEPKARKKTRNFSQAKIMEKLFFSAFFCLNKATSERDGGERNAK